MIATGLLWYDDDARRPLTAKIADAAQRFRERVGYEPTTCQLSPIAAQQIAAQREQTKRRTRKPAEPAAAELSVALEPDDALRPNYFFVGVRPDDKLKRVRGWQSSELADLEPRRRASKPRAHSPAPAVAPTPAAAPPAVRKRRESAPTQVAPTPAPVPSVVVAEKPAAAPARTTRAVRPKPPVAPPAVASAPVTKTSRPAAVSRPPTAAKRAKTPAPKAATDAPAPKIAAVAPVKQTTKDTPKFARKTQNAATPATAPAPQPAVQPAPRPRHAAKHQRAPVARSASPATAAQSSLWGDMPAATPTRRRKSA